MDRWAGVSGAVGMESCVLNSVDGAVLMGVPAQDCGAKVALASSWYK